MKEVFSNWMVAMAAYLSKFYTDMEFYTLKGWFLGYTIYTMIKLF